MKIILNKTNEYRSRETKALIEHISKLVSGGKEIGIEMASKLIDDAHSDGCLVCKKQSHAIGVFQPNNPEEFGGIKGKTRFLLYSVCETHLQAEDIATLAENELLARINKEFRESIEWRQSNETHLN